MAFAEYPVVSSSGSGGITKVADSIERNALTPADGDIVIQLDNDFLYEWNGSSWAVLADRTWQTAGSILGAKTFDSASTWSVASNQQVFGVTNTITVNYAAPSANRIYTVPDVGADAAYVMTAGNQTLGGTKTFSSAVVITPTTNQLVLGVTNTTTINSVAPSASRVYTIPDAGADASFVLTAGTQSIGGSKTFTSAVAISVTTNQLVLGTTNTATISATAPAASRTYTIADPGQSASFVMDRGTQTLQGTYTFTQQTLTQNVTSLTGGVYKITSSGTNPQLYTEYEGTAATAQTWRTGLNVDGLNLGNYVIYDFTSTVTRAALTTAGQLQLPATSNQIRLNTSINALTITSGTSAAARTYTIPDTGTTDTFAMLGGTQSFTGAKTFSSAVTISAASNQLVLSSGVNQLTLNSSTSAAARTYAFPDVGTSGTVAMLEGSQTFSGLKTFSSGLAVSGGSAANNTIWVASNVLNIRGGTSGTDIYNTSGTVVFDIADSGIVNTGPSAGLGTTGNAYHTTYGSTVSTNAANRGFYAAPGEMNIASNAYRDGASTLKAITTGGVAWFTMNPQTVGTNNAFEFLTNTISQAANTAITGSATILSGTAAGAWTLGPSTNTTAVNLRVNGRLRVGDIAASNAASQIYFETTGTAQAYLTSQTGLIFETDRAGTLKESGSVIAAGAWTWGPNASNVNHTSNGSISFTSTTTTGNAASVYQSGSRLRLNAGSSGYAFQSSDGVTSLAIASNGGAWELGPSAGGVTHRFNTNTSTTATGGARTLPANPVDFWTVNINGTDRKIPFYAT